MRQKKWEVMPGERIWRLGRWQIQLALDSLQYDVYRFNQFIASFPTLEAAKEFCND